MESDPHALSVIKLEGLVNMLQSPLGSMMPPSLNCKLSNILTGADMLTTIFSRGCKIKLLLLKQR